MRKLNLSLDIKIAENYKSKSQIARVLTEHWVSKNLYCPCCGTTHLHDFDNNRPVADFYCQTCNEEFELKSKKGKLPNIVVDGAYSTMLNRINAENNPNFFFLTYTYDWLVSNFLIIPKQFLTPDVIIRRKPLSNTAKRAGWVGCNIDLSKISDSGKIFLINNGKVIDSKTVQENFNKTLFLRSKSKTSKGWTLDILDCVDSINSNDFTLDEMYSFEPELRTKYPNNNFIKDKIRQQLQILRDNGIIEFASRGKYRKINHVRI